MTAAAVAVALGGASDEVSEGEDRVVEGPGVAVRVGAVAGADDDEVGEDDGEGVVIGNGRVGNIPLVASTVLLGT